MVTPAEIITLRLIRHTDTQSILTAFSRSHGRMALAVPAGKGRGASRMHALAAPLMRLQCMADVKPGREVSPMRGVSLAFATPSVHSHPVKQLIATLIAEVLDTVLRGYNADEPLFDFVETAIRVLDAATAERAVANFHLWFLYRLAVMMGIEPDVSTYAPGALLDVRDGLWRRSAPLHGLALDAEQSRAAWMLSRMTVSNLGCYSFTRAQRNQALDSILEYYSLHLVNLRNLKSPAILRSIL